MADECRRSMGPANGQPRRTSVFTSPEGFHAMEDHVRHWISGAEFDLDLERSRPFELVEVEVLAWRVHAEGITEFVKLDVLPLGHVDGAVRRHVDEDPVVNTQDLSAEPSLYLWVLEVEGKVKDNPM